MANIQRVRPFLVPALALAAVLALIAGGLWRRPAPVGRQIADAIRACAGHDNPKSCLRELAAHALANGEPSSVLRALQVALVDPAVANTCHLLGHYLGQETYRKTRSLPDALSSCDNTCYGSCYHGAAEAYVIDRIASGGYAADDSALAAVAGAVTNCRDSSCEERV
ncbi:MAG: hypothetical protein Q8S13_13830, partial [Dehalococcoidia bacterium]|nr:hypothetical protein [Dehalococcoidia bacterium]